MHYALICGGRDLDTPEADQAMMEVVGFLALFYGVGLRIMHGAATGIDTLAQNAADHYNVTTKAFPADWGRGPKAGPERNEKMAGLLVAWEQQGHTVEVIAFPGGRGTAHMATFADRCGLNVTHIPLESEGVTQKTG